jgi:hypothetical protein
MRQVGHIVHMGKMRNGYKISVGKPERKYHLKDLSINGRIILEWILGKYGGMVCGQDSSGS